MPGQSPEIQVKVAEAERLAHVQADLDYKVVKVEFNSQSLSLLDYLDFFEPPFPILGRSYRIDLDKQRVEKRSYEASLPPNSAS